jgi:hypothetical protein
VVRVRMPINDLSGIDAIAKIAANSDSASGALKAYTHLGSFDLAGVGIYRGAQNQLITGLTFKGDLLAGVYGELVEHFGGNNERTFVGMGGADYSIENTWYFTAEYLYNEQPQTGSPSGISPLQTSLPRLHHHYGFITGRYQISDIMYVSAGAIGDVSAKAAILTGQYFYNILQNANTIVYLQYYPASSTGLLALPVGLLTYGLRLEIAF